MSRIKSRNTKIELKFRKLVWSKGLRGYRINSKKLGKPDLYLSKTKIALFIDGCFWHKCPDCFKRPKSKNEYWDRKIQNNQQRDIEINKVLANEGIFVLRFWEHQLKGNLENCVNQLILINEKRKIKNN